MRKLLCCTTLLVPFLFLSGCILTKTPDPNVNIILVKGEQITLSVSSTGDNQWLLYVGAEAPVSLDGETGKTYLFDSNDYDMGTYRIAVQNTYFGYTENCQWTVIVTDSECTDSDGDGFSVEGGDCGLVDCDDGNAAIHPNATEGANGDPACTDTFDNDCDGVIDGEDTGCQQCSTKADCDDGNPCTTDSCSDGACVNTNNTASCDDGDACTVNDVCSDGSCIAGPQMNCNDNNECTNDSCIDGSCRNINNTVSCDDGDSCTMNDACADGTCSGELLDEDGDSYVSDTCGGDDCDDTNEYVHPGATEGPPGDGVCSDALDNDCDGDKDGYDSDCVEFLPPQSVNATDVNLDASGDAMDNNNLNDRVNIVWELVPWATGYDVYSSDEPDGPYVLRDTVLAPHVFYNDMQDQSFILSDKPVMADYFANTSNPTSAELDAYDAAMAQWERDIRTEINDFKNFKYYKVRAFNTVTESELSGYDEGKMDYTGAEGWKLADSLTQLMIYEVIKEVGVLDPVNNNYDISSCDECTPGCVAESGNNGTFQIYISGSIFYKTIRITLTNFRTSVDYDKDTDTIDCGGRRSIALSGTMEGTLFLGSGEITGTFYLSGGGIGEADVTVPVTLGAIGTGKVTLRYNGEECFECYTIALDM